MTSRHRSLLALSSIAVLVPLLALGVGCRKKPMMTKERCEATLDQARAAMKTLDVTYNGTKTCVDDKDCVEIPIPSCISFCSGMAFATKDAPSVHQRVAESEARECKAWSDADCAAIDPQPIASCALYQPRCQDSKCTMTYR